jgi:DNA-binding transcriptional regulator YiaG
VREDGRQLRRGAGTFVDVDWRRLHSQKRVLNMFRSQVAAQWKPPGTHHNYSNVKDNMTRKIREIVDGDPQTVERIANERPVRSAVPREEQFMSKGELAHRFNVTVRTVDNWMKAGIVPYFKMNRMVMFTWSDVVTHLRANYRVCQKS